MMKKPKLHPYVEITPESQKALRRHGFALRALGLDMLPEGWLRLFLRWDSSGKSASVLRNASERGTESSSGGAYESAGVALEFPEVKLPASGFDFARFASIHVGVFVKTGGGRGNVIRLGFNYRFFENLKYGCAVYFSPAGWGAGKERILFNRRGPKVALRPRAARR